MAVLSRDSAPTKVGTLIRDGTNPEVRLILTPFEPKDAAAAQVYREAVGGCVSLKAASRVVNLSGFTVLFRNDATARLGH